MAVEFCAEDESEQEHCRVIRLLASGSQNPRDYERIAPDVTELIKRHGKVRVLFEVDDFRGWTSNTLWEDVNIDHSCFNDIERIAVIGEATWEHGVASFRRPFQSAKIGFFARGETEKAKEWIVVD